MGEKSGEFRSWSVVVTIKLKMKMTQKMKIQFKSNQKHRSRSWMNICVFLFFPLIAANAFAQEVTAFDLGVKPDKGNSWCIAAAPDGSIWLAEKGGHRIEKFAPSGAITEFKTKNVEEERIAPGTPIAFGPDGNLWLLEAKYVSRITKNGEMTQYAVPMEGTRIFAGPDDNMSFLVGNHIIFKINMQGVVVDKFDLQKSPPSAIVDMVARPDGSVWYTALASSGDRIGKITRTGDVTEYTEGITKDALAGSIALGADGNMWFAEDEIGKVAKITPAGVVTEYKPLDDGIVPGKLVSGRDGNIWTIDKWDNRIVKIAPDGVAVGYHVQNVKRIDKNSNALPTGLEEGAPYDLTVDGHGDIWFVDSTNHVGRLTITPEKPAFNQTMSTQEIIDKIHTPTNPMELLKNIKSILDVHLISRSNFYTKTNLQKVFGCESMEVIENARIEDKLRGTYIALSECAKFSNSKKNSYYITLSKVKNENSVFKVRLSLRVNLDEVFPSTLVADRIFGSNWERESIEAFDGPPESVQVYRRKDDGTFSRTVLSHTAKETLSDISYLESNGEIENAK